MARRGEAQLRVERGEALGEGSALPRPAAREARRWSTGRRGPTACRRRGGPRDVERDPAVNRRHPVGFDQHDVRSLPSSASTAASVTSASSHRSTWRRRMPRPAVDLPARSLRWPSRVKLLSASQPSSAAPSASPGAIGRVLGHRLRPSSASRRPRRGRRPALPQLGDQFLPAARVGAVEFDVDDRFRAAVAAEPLELAVAIAGRPGRSGGAGGGWSGRAPAIAPATLSTRNGMSSLMRASRIRRRAGFAAGRLELDRQFARVRDRRRLRR